MTTTEWLTARRSGIGGTDIAAILGLSKHRTRYDVYLEKRGEAPKFEGNAYTISGQRLERIVVEYFEEATGLTCEVPEKISRNADLPDFILGSLDRIAKDADGNTYVLETKTTQNQTDADTYPEAWYAQLQWYLGITGLQKGFIAWLVKGVFFDYVEVDYNDEYFRQCLDIASEFWNENVLKGIPPEPTTSQDVLKRWPLSEPGAVVEASPYVLDLVTQLRKVKKQAKELEEKQTELEEALKLTLRDAEYLSYQGQVLLTWKSTKPTQRLDTDRLRSEQPDLYEKYLKPAESSRRFLTK